MSRSSGFATPDALIGVGVALLVVASGLVLTRGMMQLARTVAADSSDGVAARWAVDRIARELRMAGIGVAPSAELDCPDERLELIDEGVLALRGDLDGDDRMASRNPEPWLAGRFPIVATGNDEVVVFLRRTASGGGSGRAEFDADLDGPDRTVLSDGTPVARRDGAAERIDAGPHTGPGYSGRGVLYRVSFVHDAAKFGSGRFRVVEPLVDGATEFSIRGIDARGSERPACGGLDGPDAVACRAEIAAVDISLRVGTAGAVRRRVPLPAVYGRGWQDE